MKSKALHIAGVPLITFLLFVFECSDPRYYVYELLWSFFISLALWQGNGLLIKGLDHYIPWRSKAGPRVFIQLGVSVLFTVWLTYFAVRFLYADVYEAHFSSLVFRRNLFVFLIISLLYNALYTGSHFFRKWRKSIIESEELKRQHLISQYESLKNQVNPHFLFNSVNTMIALIDEDPKLAKEFGHTFAEIYRQILVKGKKRLITVKEELEIVEIQRDLFRSRFGEGVEFIIDISPSDLTKMIPPLTVQMLVENAVKHNRISVGESLRIEIIGKEGRLSVGNNLQRKNVRSDSTGTGLDNIRKRYECLGKPAVVIEDGPEQFKVVVPLLEMTEI